MLIEGLSKAKYSVADGGNFRGPLGSLFKGVGSFLVLTISRNSLTSSSSILADGY